ncbi:MAG: nucleoside-triphosphatase [Elusimicrobia bacterium]|nr:nucleoside-triphosphatase [Elusimicrobiota bacterium]
MNRDQLWRKAAVLGSLWAASEIVLGSFLHNARVPLRGHLLTGIGVAILVAGHRLWPERGLLWRSGLICAAMKSVSPSAVILAPMVAISMEGLLLELGVRAAGANAAGYLLGGGLAMSWPLFHTLGNILLFYGPETWTIYVRGFETARSWLGLPGGPWGPILALWAAHALGGGAAAAMGMRVGAPGALPEPAGSGTAGYSWTGRPGEPRRCSLWALSGHALFIAVVLARGGGLPLWGYAAVCAAYVLVCAAGYGRAAALGRRFGLWLGVLAVSILAGLALGRWQAGARMGLRALMLTMGFACVGEELRHPALRRAVERLAGPVFFDALEQAFLSLPGVFAALPAAPRLLRDPIGGLRAALARAPALLSALAPGRAPIITGPSGSGKSSLVARAAAELRGRGLSVAGLHAPGFWEAGRRAGFDVVDLRTGQSRPLCRAHGPSDWPAVRAFRFSPEGVAFGLRALAEAVDADVAFVDEVGPWELEGGGWAPALETLARKRRRPTVWVVRPGLVDAVRARWGLSPDAVWTAGKDEPREIVAGLGIEARPAGRQA